MPGNILTSAAPVVTPSPPLTSEMPDNCTFEVNTCDWVVDDPTLWIRQVGSESITADTGPPFDHTTIASGNLV